MIIKLYVISALVRKRRTGQTDNNGVHQDLYGVFKERVTGIWRGELGPADKSGLGGRAWLFLCRAGKRTSDGALSNGLALCTHVLFARRARSVGGFLEQLNGN